MSDEFKKFKDLVKAIVKAPKAKKRKIQRSLGVTQRTGWFMLHRIRLAMQNGSVEKLSGHVEVTEGQPDSARYRQMGNAIAVPVVEWIGRRIMTLASSKAGK